MHVLAREVIYAYIALLTIEEFDGFICIEHCRAYPL
jgi:hypothetical protein